MHPTRWTAVMALSLLATAAAVPASAQDWKGRGRVEGTVTTEDGQPIEGVKVSLSPASDPEVGPEPTYTNKKGRWSYLGLIGGTWKIVLEKEGFITSEGSTSISEFGRNAPVVVEMKPNPFAAIGRGDALLDEKRYAEARAEYESSLPHLPPEQQVRLRARIGDTFFEEGDMGSALGVYQAIISHLEPAEQAHVLLRLADIQAQQGNLAMARSRYEQALPSLAPADQARILVSIARAWDQEGDREQAIATLERALALSPDEVSVLQLIADLLSREGRDEEAEAYLARLPEDVHLPPDMVLNLGIRLYNEGDPEAAMPHFERAVAENPNLPDAYYYRGLVYLSRQENDAAKADFLKLLELAPEHAKAGEVREFLSFLE